MISRDYDYKDFTLFMSKYPFENGLYVKHTNSITSPFSVISIVQHINQVAEEFRIK